MFPNELITWPALITIGGIIVAVVSIVWKVYKTVVGDSQNAILKRTENHSKDLALHTSRLENIEKQIEGLHKGQDKLMDLLIKLLSDNNKG